MPWPIPATARAALPAPICQHDVAAVPSTQTIATLGAQFQALRPLLGHFDGNAWNDVIDRYGAHKYCVMDALRVLIDAQHPELTEAIQTLGKPDAQWRAGEAPRRALSFELRVAEVDEVLWYRWRGTRDGLVLLVRANRIKHAIWSTAGE